MSSIGGQEVLFSKALFRSLSESPLLVEDLREASAWRTSVSGAIDGAVLNFDQKLGHLYEDALELLIRESGRFELLAKNLQVFDALGRTIGEMDFVLRDRESDEVYQLELAVKFYLSVLLPDGTEEYPGPDPRDNWINKLERMRSRQLQLSKRDEARSLLKERFGVAALNVRQRIYGIIFDHISVDRVSSPPSVSVGCRRAKWLYVKEWHEFFGAADRLRIVPKCLWPVVLDRELVEALEEVSAGELLEQAEQRGLMFWDQNSGEVYFLVPNQWPESA